MLVFLLDRDELKPGSVGWRELYLFDDTGRVVCAARPCDLRR